MLRRFTFISLVAALLSVAVPAQDLSRSVGLSPSEWGLQGGGADYHAVFDRAGFEFTPALGSRAPRAFPLRLSFDRAQRAGRDLALASPVEPSRGELSVDYHRGGGLVEHYELTAAGVEQSFVLRARPAGVGDLVIRQRLRTELSTDLRGDCSAGLELRCEFGGVAIGRAVAIDALGRRSALTMRYDGVNLELVAPDALLASAAYPLLLDPPIGTIFDLSTAQNDLNADVAYDDSSDMYLVVWQRRISAVRADVLGQLVRSSGALVGSAIDLRVGGDLAINPAVAVVAPNDRFLVVWQEAPAPFGPWNLHCRSVDSGSGLASNVVQINTHPANDINPDVSGSLTHAVLVWERQGDGVRAARIDVPRVGDPGVVTGATFAPGSRPSINARRAAVFLVAWEDDSGGVSVGAFSSTPSLVVGPVSISANARAPAVDGQGGDFVVAYEVPAAPTRVACRSIQASFSAITPTSSERSLGSGAVDRMTPAVASVADKFVVAWAQSSGGFLDHDLHYRAVGIACEDCGVEHTVRTDAAASDAHPAIASQSGGGGDGDRALIVFSTLDNATLAAGVRGQLYEAYGGQAARTVGARCGNGGTARASGAFAIGNLEFRAELNGAAAGASAGALFLGFVDRVFTCGSCTLIDPVLTFPAAVTNGTASFPIPLFCDYASVVGGSFDVQWLTLATGASPCPLVDGLSASTRLRLTVDY